MYCLACGTTDKAEEEYLGYNRLFCKKCNSRHIKSGFICEPKEQKEQKNENS